MNHDLLWYHIWTLRNQWKITVQDGQQMRKRPFDLSTISSIQTNYQLIAGFDRVSSLFCHSDNLFNTSPTFQMLFQNLMLGEDPIISPG